MKLPEKLKSRKFWIGLLAAVMPIACQFLSESMDMDMAMKLSSAALCTYMVSQGIVDAKTMEGWVPKNLQPELEGDAE